MTSNEGMTMEALIEFFRYNHQQTQFLNWDLPIEVCMSGAGYYVGQMEDGEPYTRLSNEYWATREEAEEALNNFQFTARTWL